MFSRNGCSDTVAQAGCDSENDRNAWFRPDNNNNNSTCLSGQRELSLSLHLVMCDQTQFTLRFVAPCGVQASQGSF
jgi:hypothetical protein